MNAERAAGLVRRWVAFYTRGLPAGIRQDRRDEIEDDLWNQLRDAAASARPEPSLTGEIVARLVFGIPADLSWRAEQRHGAGTPVAPERSSTMGARVVASLAILGGVGWAIWPIPQALVGREWPAGEPVSTLLFFSVVGGTWLLAGAIFGLVTEFQDRIRGRAALLGSLGAVMGAFSVFGAFAAIVALPLGSAALAWDLGRARVLGPGTSNAHVAGAVIFLIMFAVIMAIPALYDDRTTAVPLLMLAIPYAFSWIAIGWSLRHGAPVPEQPVEKVS
jgi:hypothetical protein